MTSVRPGRENGLQDLVAFLVRVIGQLGPALPFEVKVRRDDGKARAPDDDLGDCPARLECIHRRPVRFKTDDKIDVARIARGSVVGGRIARPGCLEASRALRCGHHQHLRHDPQPPQAIQRTEHIEVWSEKFVNDVQWVNNLDVPAVARQMNRKHAIENRRHDLMELDGSPRE